MNERTEPAEVQRSRGGPTLSDWEDSIEDMRERGGESPLADDGAETDLDQGVKRGLINLENEFLGRGRDWREDVEDVDGLKPMTGGRGGGGTEVGVDGMDSMISGPGDSSRWVSSSRPSGSGTTGRGANLIFRDWVGLGSSSGGRMETLTAGELGRDLAESRGDVVRRIDCNVGFAIVLGGGDWGGRGGGWRRRRRWTYTFGT